MTLIASCKFENPKCLFQHVIFAFFAALTAAMPNTDNAYAPEYEHGSDPEFSLEESGVCFPWSKSGSGQCGHLSGSVTAFPIRTQFDSRNIGKGSANNVTG